MIKRLLVLCAIPAMLALTGCGDDRVATEPHVSLAPYNSRASYFDGQVAVQYHQNRSNVNDFVSVTMYQAGTYKVEFSYPPDAGTGGGSMLSNFTITVPGPREQIIQQDRLPFYIRVTITKEDGSVEFHDLG